MSGNESPPFSTVPRALGRLRVALDDAYLRASRERGLTAQQAELLCAAMQPTAVGDLARVLRCDQSNVTRLVDRASKRGLIRRRNDEGDGRVTLIDLTPKGRRLAERFIESLEAQTADLVAGWSAERQTATIKALNQIANTLDAARPTIRQPASPRATSRQTGDEVLSR